MLAVFHYKASQLALSTYTEANLRNGLRSVQLNSVEMFSRRKRCDVDWWWATSREVEDEAVLTEDYSRLLHSDCDWLDLVRFIAAEFRKLFKIVQNQIFSFTQRCFMSVDEVKRLSEVAHWSKDEERVFYVLSVFVWVPDRFIWENTEKIEYFVREAQIPEYHGSRKEAAQTRKWRVSCSFKHGIPIHWSVNFLDLNWCLRLWLWNFQEIIHSFCIE